MVDQVLVTVLLLEDLTLKLERFYMMSHVIEINRCGTLVKEFNTFNSDLCELVGRSYLFNFFLLVAVLFGVLGG